jgi:hypothetical protein
LRQPFQRPACALRLTVNPNQPFFVDEFSKTDEGTYPSNSTSTFFALIPFGTRYPNEPVVVLNFKVLFELFVGSLAILMLFVQSTSAAASALPCTLSSFSLYHLLKIAGMFSVYPSVYESKLSENTFAFVLEVAAETATGFVAPAMNIAASADVAIKVIFFIYYLR